MEANINDIIFTVPGTSSSLLCEPFCTECTNVRIVDDNIFEAKFENFSLSLSHSDPAVQITSTSTTVTIEDNNSKPHNGSVASKFWCSQSIYFCLQQSIVLL